MDRAPESSVPGHRHRPRVEITVCRAADLPALDWCLRSPGAPSFHAPRFARQQAGESTYLVARLDGEPAGHAEIRWRGCAAPEVPVTCPEINGLGVRDGLRSRGIGTALIHRAEDPVRERGADRRRARGRRRQSARGGAVRAARVPAAGRLCGPVHVPGAGRDDG
ncbi:GNAT family N-acetyltransferase [Streptomyces sp. NPDC004610]|uniref:GNAT family N-acetyltransferase n=1 Tax=unclassified Streptomyces TaxID=2593676 RepID=UPI0033A1D020